MAQLLPSRLTRMRQPLRRGFVVVALLVIAACDRAGTMTEIPRPATAPAKIVSFTGTLQPGGRASYTFTVAQDGYVQATLVGLGAETGTTVGLGIGTASATACSVIQSVTTAAGPAAQLIGTGLAGTLCVTIFDEGKLTAPTLYTITVASS